MSEYEFNNEALQAGLALGKPKELSDGTPYAVIPQGAELRPLTDLILKTPLRKKASVSLTDAAGFIKYVNEYGGADTVIFTNGDTGEYTAVLDYHARADGAPAWMEHRAKLRLAPTKEWLTWTGMDKKVFTQVQFAEFLESNLPDIAEPSGATILEAALNLSSKRDVSFKSATRLSDGTSQFLYEETDATKGGIKLPEEFVLGLKPFEGMTAYRVGARLRHRIKEGALTFFYELVRPHLIVKDAIEATTKVIEQGVNLTSYRGNI